MTIDNNIYKIKTFLVYSSRAEIHNANPYLINVIFLYFHFKCLLIAGMRFSVTIMHDFVPRLHFRIWFIMKYTFWLVINGGEGWENFVNKTTYHPWIYIPPFHFLFLHFFYLNHFYWKKAWQSLKKYRKSMKTSHFRKTHEEKSQIKDNLIQKAVTSQTWAYFC